MRLQDYTTANAVPKFSCAITPGRHCPLFGVAAALRNVSGITLIYIGTQDCVYYAQKDAMVRHLTASDRKADHFRTLAAELSDSDLIFGIRPQLEKLLQQEAARADTRAIYLVTSCSVEVLSEDLQSIIKTVAKRTGKRIQLIPTENFKTFSYYQGIEDALTALTAELAPRQTLAKHFAVLGVRQPGGRESEPVRYLQERGYTLHSILPYDTDLDRIEELSGMEFTLVLEGSGLGVAKKLHERFGIPYVRFDRMLHLESIVESWNQLAQITGDDLTAWLTEQCAEIKALSDEAASYVSGRTFFYGQKVLYPFETCLFLAKLGMKPAAIFLGSSVDKSDEARQELLEYGNPIMWQNASHAAIRAELDHEAPDYAIGIADTFLRPNMVKSLEFQIKPLMSGFEYYKLCLNQLLNLAKTEDVK